MSQSFTKGTPIDTDPTLSLNSDIVVPSQKAVKSYVASQIGTPVTSVNATAPILSSGGPTPNISMPAATSSVNGYLTSTDWNTFNSKENALTFSSPLSRVTNTISIPAATGSVNGYLTSTDWTTFNSKQPQLNGTGFVKASGTTISYDNSTYYLASNPSGYTSNLGTVTSVAALTLGTSGTDLSSTVANGTTTPVITLNVPTASATNRGVLSTTDWSTFNNKAPLASPAFTGNPTAPTPSFGDNDTSIATTAFVQAAANTPSLIKVNANLTAAVNSTSLTTLYSFYIPANTVAAGDMIHVVGRARKSPIAANGSCSMRIYVNTSATAGGSIVGLLSTGAANNVYMHMRRDISITNATNSSIVFINTTTAGDDATASNGASNVLVIDWTVDQYIILGITPGSATDTWYGMGFRAEIKKYNI